jgi:hypothetical protein
MAKFGQQLLASSFSQLVLASKCWPAHFWPANFAQQIWPALFWPAKFGQHFWPAIFLGQQIVASSFWPATFGQHFWQAVFLASHIKPILLVSIFPDGRSCKAVLHLH